VVAWLWHKAKAKIVRLHARISNIRADALHKLTTELVGRFTVISIEDLNVRGMMAHDRLSRSIADMGFYAFRRQLAYKAAMYGSRVVMAGRWHPSSKTCSDCGVVLEALPLSVRAWDCPDYGSHHDRDVNAAKNLMQLAVSSTVVACGEEGSGLGRKAKVKPASVKQGSNIEAIYA